MSAQLIVRFGLDDAAPGGMLPEWTQAPGGFESLLAAASSTRTGQDPVVLVVDGLDEADTPAPGEGLPFGLPWLLPEGQVKLFAAMLQEEKVIIAQHRIPDETTETTQVRELLDSVDLRNAVITADAAHAQRETAEYIAGKTRAGVRACFRCWLLSAWPGRALPAAVLARLAGVDPAAVRRWCDLALRPLLTTAGAPAAGGRLRYEICHASFREFLSSPAGDMAAHPGAGSLPA